MQFQTPIWTFSNIKRRRALVLRSVPFLPYLQPDQQDAIDLCISGNTALGRQQSKVMKSLKPRGKYRHASPHQLSSHRISRGAHPVSHKWSSLLKARSLCTTVPGLSLDLRYGIERQKRAVELWCRLKVRKTRDGLRRHARKGIKGCFVRVMTWNRFCSLQHPIIGFILVWFNSYLRSLHQQVQLLWLSIILADRELEMDANYFV